MKTFNRAFLTLMIIIFSAGQADNYSTGKAEDRLNENLLRTQQFLREANTIDELLAMEKEQLAKLTKIEAPTAKDAITLQQAENLLQSISPHPVVGNVAYPTYNRSPIEIGYCFGRATYVHLALLKMGVKKDAIKKIWTVGETGGAMNWIYHVATAVRTTDGNWTVIDNFVGRLITTQDWATYMRTMTIDGKKATFITDAKKFAPTIGKYSRVQLGLNLSKDKDHYKHYFVDLFKWFGSLESHKYFLKYGITHVSGEPLKLPARLQPRIEDGPPPSLVSRMMTKVCSPLRFANIFRRAN